MAKNHRRLSTQGIAALVAASTLTVSACGGKTEQQPSPAPSTGASTLADGRRADGYPLSMLPGVGGEGSPTKGSDGQTVDWFGDQLGSPTKMNMTWLDTKGVLNLPGDLMSQLPEMPTLIAVSAIDPNWSSKESWRAAANGEYLQRWKELAQNLAEYRKGQFTVISGNGELNCEWFNSTVNKSNVNDFKRAWQLFVKTIYEFNDKRDVKIALTPAAANKHTIELSEMFPGKEYVDLIGFTMYHDSPKQDLKDFAAFAKDKGLGIVGVEVGLRGSERDHDNPEFIRFMSEWFKTNALNEKDPNVSGKVVGFAIFNANHSGDGKFMLTGPTPEMKREKINFPLQNPKSWDEYRRQWGNQQENSQPASLTLSEKQLEPYTASAAAFNQVPSGNDHVVRQQVPVTERPPGRRKASKSLGSRGPSHNAARTTAVGRVSA